MTGSKDQEAFERLVQRLYPGSRLCRIWALEGGISAQATAVEIEQPGGRTKRLVLRRHNAVEIKRNPHLAADEFKLLQILLSAGIPVPMPCHVSQAGEIFPTPCLVVEYIAGDTAAVPADLDDHMGQVVAQLARIHGLDGGDPGLSFLPRVDTWVTELLNNRPAEPDGSWSEGRIREALESVWPLARQNAPVLLHGDFWPGNVLWRDGRLVAVIDWEDAALGDPLADVANARLELLWAYGPRTMQAFTDRYAATIEVDFADLACWDLWAALHPIPWIHSWGLDAADEEAKRQGHHAFVVQALERLSAPV